MDADSVASDWLARHDDVLRELIRTHGPVSHTPTRAGFADIAEAIVCQQLSAKAGASIWKRLLGVFPDGKVTPTAVTGTTEEHLRSAGVSRSKARYIRNAAVAFSDGTVTPERFDAMDDEAVIGQLVIIKGVGRWTAEMFLMFSLGRPDVFSFGDLGLRNAMMRAYGWKHLPDEKTMVPVAEKWRPYRTYAALLLWKSLANV